MDKKNKKPVLSTPTPIRRTDSAPLTNGSLLGSNQNVSTTQSSVLGPSKTTRPPYPLPIFSSSEDAHEYEEPLDSPTKSQKALPVPSSSINRKTEASDVELLPPLPKSRPPVHLLDEVTIQNEYDEPDDKTYNFTSTFEVPNDSTAVASSTAILNKNSKTLANGDLVETHSVLTMNSLYLERPTAGKKVFFSNAADDYEEITPGEEYKVTFPLDEKDLEPSTLILMTQQSVDNSSYPGSPDRKLQLHNGFSDDNEDYFKVNVVKYDTKRRYSLSEDEMSGNELDTEDGTSYIQKGYTSQAASIFFGLDMVPEEPPIPRPRKVDLQRPTNDEEDC